MATSWQTLCSRWRLHWQARWPVHLSTATNVPAKLHHITAQARTLHLQHAQVLRAETTPLFSACVGPGGDAGSAALPLGTADLVAALAAAVCKPGDARQLRRLAVSWPVVEAGLAAGYLRDSDSEDDAAAERVRSACPVRDTCRPVTRCSCSASKSAGLL